jgi:hypothetical protein
MLPLQQQILRILLLQKQLAVAARSIFSPPSSVAS